MWRYGLRSYVGRLSPQIASADQLVVALILPMRELGLFVAGLALIGAPRLAVSAVALVAFPRASAGHHVGERIPARQMLVLSMAAAVAFALFAFVAARPVVGLLFGRSFGPAATVVQILAVGEIARSPHEVAIEFLRGIGRPGLTSVAEGANWIVFCTFAVLGAKFGGLDGAAAGMSAASIVSLGAYSTALKRRVR